VPGRALLVADGPAEMAARIGEVLAGRHPGLGARGRAAVMAGHDWEATLARLDTAISGRLSENFTGPNYNFGLSV